MKTKTIPLRNIVYVGVFVALEIALTRPFRMFSSGVNFGFMSVAMISALLGPIYGMIAAVLSDLLGCILFPQGAYFPGFALTAALRALMFGVLFYKNDAIFLDNDAGVQDKFKAIGLCALASLWYVTVNLFTLPLWYKLLGYNKKGYWIQVLARLDKTVLFFIIQTITLPIQFRCLKPFMQKFHKEKRAV